MYFLCFALDTGTFSQRFPGQHQRPSLPMINRREQTYGVSSDQTICDAVSFYSSQTNDTECTFVGRLHWHAEGHLEGASGF